MPPVWPANLLQMLARYVFHTGNRLCAGDNVPWKRSLDNTDSNIQHLLIAKDPQLNRIQTPYGWVDFCQVVGVTEEELDQATWWNGNGVLNLLKKDRQTGSAWLITDMARSKSVFELFPDTLEQLQENLETEGSDLAGINAEFSFKELPKVKTRYIYPFNRSKKLSLFHSYSSILGKSQNWEEWRRTERKIRAKKLRPWNECQLRRRDCKQTGWAAGKGLHKSIVDEHRYQSIARYVLPVGCDAANSGYCDTNAWPAIDHCSVVRQIFGIGHTRSHSTWAPFHFQKWNAGHHIRFGVGDWSRGHQKQSVRIAGLLDASAHPRSIDTWNGWIIWVPGRDFWCHRRSKDFRMAQI